MLDLRDLLACIGAKAFPQGDAGAVAITHVCVDSRQARPGSLFVALKGERVDGHDYAAAAFAAGATVALVNRPVEGAATFLTGDEIDRDVPVRAPVAICVADPLRALQTLATSYLSQHRQGRRVVAVTGSVGKTTAKEAIAAVLGERYRLLKSEGNANNEIGLPLTVMGLASEHQVVVLEMAMYALGEIALLCQIARPDVGVVTNIGPTHLERLGTIERIAQAKGELVQALPANGCAILNGDDPLARGLGALSQAPVITFGLGAENTVRATDVRVIGLDGISFCAHVKAGGLFGQEELDVPLRTTLLGAHAVYPALAAVAVGRYLGVGWEEIAAGLMAVREGLRLVPLAGPNGSRLLDDSYNASPASTRAALDLLATLPGRHLALLGDMLELGTAEEQGHREVGVRCAQTVDVLWTLGDRGKMISQAAAMAGMGPDRVRHLADADEAIALARAELGPGDTLLIKGSRGMAMEGIVAALRAED